MHYGGGEVKVGGEEKNGEEIKIFIYVSSPPRWSISSWRPRHVVIFVVIFVLGSLSFFFLNLKKLEF